MPDDNILKRALDVAKRLLGLGRQEEQPPPAVPPSVQEEAPVAPLPPPPTVQPGGTPTEYGVYDEGDNVVYIERHDRVLPRWTVGSDQSPADLDSVRAIINKVPYKDTYPIIITGILSEEYPGKEGETVVTLSHLVEYQSMFDALDDPNVQSAEDWINMLQPPSNFWQWDQVISIDLVDR